MFTDVECGTYSIHNGDEEFNVEQTWIDRMEGIEGAWFELEKFVLTDVSDSVSYSMSAALSAAVEVGKIHGRLCNPDGNVWNESLMSADPESTWHRVGIDVVDNTGTTTWRYWIQRDA